MNDDRPDVETFLTKRGPDVHRTELSSPFGQVARRLRSLVGELSGAAQPFDGASVLDFGCADSPYRDLFDGAEYLAADLAGNPHATMTLRDDGTVPVPDDSVDLVLSTQVLEHVADPELYLRECSRVLRPGGHLVLTTHGIMYLHRDPTDYWRWTCDGLARVVERAGLEVVEVRGVLGLVGAALQLLQAGTANRVPKLLRRPLVVAFQVAIGLAERRTSELSRRENGLVLAVRAVKPSLTA